MGKPADEAALGAMIAEAPGPLDFQMLLQLFGEKMSGTDPEETIMAGWHLFDPTASGEMGVDAVKNLLCSSSFSVRRCPALTPRRPSWPDGTCSTPPPPVSWCILDRLCRPSFSHHVTRGRRSGSSSRLLI